MNRIQLVLRAISSKPKTALELAQELSSSEAALLGMLETLTRGGFVQQASPPSSAGCGVCNIKSMCRVADQDPNELKLHLYRLTTRGISALHEV
jgi:predicted ArsR family transcriptional regulator